MPNLLVYGSPNGIKSIPLQNLPPEAWKNVVGGSDTNGGNVLARFEDIPWLHRGVVARCNALSGMPFGIHVGDEDGDELDKNEYPFECNFRQLFYALYQDYILLARAYTFINKNLLGGVTQDETTPYLRRFQPETIEPKYDEMAGIRGYERRLGGKTIPLPKEAIAAWFVPPTKTETGFGASDAMVALKAAGVIHNMDEYLEGHFENGAVNPTLIMLSQPFNNDSDKERFRDWLRRRITGVKNANKVEPLEGDAKVLTLGSPLKDLAATELTTSKREDIATALGVPQSVLFSNAANYATAMQDDLHFYDKTINPDARTLAEVLNESVFKPLGYALVFHPERMEIYQRLEADKATSIVTLTGKPVMTVREGRVASSLTPEPAADDPQYDEFVKQEKPEPPPPKTDTQQSADNADTTDNEFAQEMKRWQAVALTRFKENRLQKALDFKSDVIPATLMSAVKGALETVKHTDEIKAVFADSMHWAAYP